MADEMMHMRVEGLSDIEQLLKKLPKANQRKIKRGALRAGSRVVVKAQRENIDRIPNERLGQSGKRRFKKSVGVVTSKSRRHEASVYVGPRYSGVKHIAPDAHLFEFGTEDRFTEAGARRGRIKATPFVRPAWDAEKAEAVDQIRRELLERTLDEAVKLSKIS